MHPKVSIVILNWNGLEDTIECLESLKKITYPNYDIILVDNGSKGSDARILREKFQDYIHIIANDKNYGFAEGCNIGMRYALKYSAPDYILLLNNDTIVDPDFLTEMVKVAESDPLLGISGPKIYWRDTQNKIQSAGGQIRWASGRALLIGYGETDKGQFDEIKETDWVSGCALLIKRRVIEEIGLLPSAYFAYFEDVEWCVKCRKAGYAVVYTPGSKIWHKSWESTGRGSGIALYYSMRNRFIFMKRNSTRLTFAYFFVRFFAKDFLYDTRSLLVGQKNIRKLAQFYRGVGAGIRFSISHIFEHADGADI